MSKIYTSADQLIGHTPLLEDVYKRQSITINYKTTTPAYVSSYEYNEMTGLYERYRNGSPYYDCLLYTSRCV